MIKHHSEAVDYSDLDFEAIDKEMMADKELERARADEQAEVESGDEAEGLEGAPVDPCVDPTIDLIANPAVDLAI